MAGTTPGESGESEEAKRHLGTENRTRGRARACRLGAIGWLTNRLFF